MSIVPNEVMRKLISVKNRCILLLLTMTMLSFFCVFGQQGLRQPSHIGGMDSWRVVQQSDHFSNLYSQTTFTTRQINIKKQPQINSSHSYRPLGNLDCIDTSSRFFIKTDSATFYATTPVKTADGNLLVSGQYFYFSNGAYVEKGFLMKTDVYGTVLWTKLYDSLNHQAYSFINYYNVIELKDGSILLAGSTNTNDRDFTATDLIVTKTDNNGNVTWSKIYTSRILGASYNEYFGTQQIKEDSLNGDLYITGPNRRKGYNIIKLNTADGSITWSKLYQPPFRGYDNIPFGIDIGAVEIHSFGCFQSGNGSYINAYRINKNTGDIIDAKYYQVGNSYITPLTFFVPDPLVKLASGNYALSGSLWGYRHYGNGDDNDPYYQSGVVQMNSNLDFVNAYCFRNSVYVDSYTKTTIYPDGSGMCHMMEVPPANFYAQTTHAIQFDNGTIIKQRKAHHLNEGYPKDNGWVRLPGGGEMSVLTTYDSINKTSSLLFTKLHLTDTASDCLGVNENVTFTEPYQIQFLPDAQIDSVGSNVFQLLPDRMITAENFISKLQSPACNQTAFCDTFAMKLSADSVCAFTPVNITITKRRVCGSEVLFNFDSSVIQSFVRANDSVYTVIFKAAWRGKIFGSLKGCRLFTDSVQLTALAPLPILNLGADTVLCSGGQIVLHTGKGYESYQWQDGSTDSTLTVTKAGTYYVVAKNKCSGTFTDTIIIAAYPVIPFSLGPDTVLCPGNTIALHAPAGYQNYLWQNGLTDTVLTVTKPGIFYLTANITCAGSFTDTIVVLNHAPIPFDLGPGLSLCSNDTISIKAPSGFISYQWSPGYNISGVIGQTVVVRPLADTIYKVTAEKTPGCFVSDSIRVTVNAVPAIYLGADTSLCFGDSIVLNAGSGFAQYQWIDGSLTQQVAVHASGNYIVTGTTLAGCKSHDTLTIVNVWTNPVVNLDDNPDLCKGSTRTLQAGSYSSYRWQDGSSSPTYIASGIGTYYVTVTDSHQCRGSDTAKIVRILSIPANFLPADTAVCSYGEIVLKTNQTYTTYLWSNGQAGTAVTITRPGLYWLQATDANSCIGRDSVMVVAKDCMKGLYVPTAFSPNLDGKNDLFKPLIFGNVAAFKWKLYNRYGQIIFSADNPSSGWDGTVKGVLQNSGVFTWVCHYQFAGETVEVKTGSVLLVR